MTVVVSHVHVAEIRKEFRSVWLTKQLTVEVVVGRQMTATCADIANVKGHVVRQLVLDLYVELMHLGSFDVRQD